MRFYRLHRYHDVEGSQGFVFFVRRADAEREARRFRQENLAARGDSLQAFGFLADGVNVDKDLTTGSEIEVVEIEPTKAGILAALNAYASHPDNG